MRTSLHQPIYAARNAHTRANRPNKPHLHQRARTHRLHGLPRAFGRIHSFRSERRNTRSFRLEGARNSPEGRSG